MTAPTSTHGINGATTNGRSAPTVEPVAIIGMACIFPGAPDLQTYWSNIVEGISAIGDPPPDWRAEDYLDPASSANDRVYTCRGGWLGDLARFDPLAHGVMPSSVDGGEPDQYLALEVAQRALTHAGLVGEDRSRTGVIIGHGTYINRGFGSVLQHGVVIDQTLRILRRLHPEHTEPELAMIKDQLKAGLPPFDAAMAPGLVPNVMSGRIANRLDLMGPNFTVDAACASSLVALDLALTELRTGRCDVMLVGGVHTSTPAPILQIFCQLEAVSRTGEIRSFGADADGTLLGEGLGFVVLKRLTDAVRAGDRVYAVVRSVGVASDGRASGLLAPRIDGERLALQRAYQQVGIDPATIGLIEAHGTGTPAGDAAELTALGDVLGGRDPSGPSVALGTVKSMISHLLPAAGMAGLIKTALALHHKVLPPTLQHGPAHPALADSRCYLNTETRPWVHPTGRPRRAGVDAFGFGGINAHALLEEFPGHDRQPVTVSGPTRRPAHHPRPHWPTEVVLLAAANRQRLIGRCRELADDLGPDDDLTAVAATAAAAIDGPEDGERLAIVASSTGELGTLLGRAVDLLADPADRKPTQPGLYYTPTPLGPGGTAFLFPGEGSPYTGMLTETAVAFPEIREWFDLMDAAFERHPRGLLPSRAIFPPPGDDTARLLSRMDLGPEALFAASQGLLGLLGRFGVRPNAAAGHSSGEWSALVAAGALSTTDRQQVAADVLALNALYERARADGGIPAATLLAVGAARPEEVRKAIGLAGGAVQVAMDNCPHQLVLCGPDDAMTMIEAELGRRGAVCERLPFDRAYHTSSFTPFAELIRRHLDNLEITRPELPLWSACSTDPFPNEPAAVRDLAGAQWAKPVRWTETITAMYDAGSRVFVEVGPGARVTGFVRDILHGRPHLAVSVDGPPGGLRALCQLVGQLYVHRIPVDPGALFEGRVNDAHPTRPVPRLATALSVLELPDSFSTRPESAAEDTEQRPAAPTGPAVRSAAVADGRADVIAAHLQTMSQFLQLQNDVMAAYLGGPVRPVAAVTAPQLTGTPLEDPQPAAVSPAMTSPPPEQDVQPGAGPRPAIADLVRQLLSDRTGYPPEMITDEMDLESDLGIDSIKRTEIIGGVQQRLGPLDGSVVAALRPLRTMTGIVNAMEQGYRSPAGTPGARGHDHLPADDDHQPAGQPWLDEVLEFVRGRQLVARHTFDLAVDPFLADHTIERRPPSRRDRHLVGLPIVPLTATLEVVAEAAVALAGSGVVTMIADVTAEHWISLEGGRRTVRVSAEATRPQLAGATAVAVTVTEDDPDGAGIGRRLLAATVTVEATYPEPPEPLTITGTGPVPDHHVYGSDGMFHGPAFQVVTGLEAGGAHGATASLSGRGTRELDPAGSLLTDVALLDGPGQVLALWLLGRADQRVDIFPVRIDRLTLYCPAAPGPARYRCVVAVRELTEDAVVSDLDVLDAGGRPVARFAGWQDVRLALPAELRSFLGRPDQALLSRPWQPPGAPDSTADLCGRRLELPPSLVTGAGGLWLGVLAYAVLGPAERPVWHRLDRAAPTRRADWLAGRIAAKEAVRCLLDATDGAARADIDIEIGDTADGPPMIIGPAELLPSAPRISIAHSAGVAVAVAVRADRADAIGVDLQAVDQAVTRLGATAYATPERELLDRLDETSRRRWAARLWTAKEAAAKAAGTGLPLVPAVLAVDPEDLIPVDPLDPVRLTVRRLDGEPPGSASTVWTTVGADDLASALCLSAPSVAIRQQELSEGVSP